MSEEKIPYETDLWINVQGLALAFYVYNALELRTLPLAIPKHSSSAWNMNLFLCFTTGTYRLISTAQKSQ